MRRDKDSLDDIRQRTETAMQRAPTLLAAELALRAQAASMVAA